MSGKDPDGIPRTQVELQLKRILQSAVFMGRDGYKPVEKLAVLLNYIVTETLDGKGVSDASILIDLYGCALDELDYNNTARKAVQRLRPKLEIYYATEGIDDPVSIEIPMGKYPAVFSYNPRTYAQKEIKIGQHHVNRETPDHIEHALIHFKEAIKREDTLAEAYAGKANALLTATMHTSTGDIEGLIADSEAAAFLALQHDPNSWRGHAVLGAVNLYRHEWTKSDAEFNEARRLGLHELDSIAAFGPYLVSRGHSKEAIDLAERYLNEGVDNVVLLSRAGFLFYGLGEYERSKNVLLEALQMDPHFWRAHINLAYTLLAINKPEEALFHMLQVKALAGQNLWPGLRILCLEAAGRAGEAEREFTTLVEGKEVGQVQSKQLALAYMALGRPLEAIASLSLACDNFDPFTAWLPVWPVLEPLRRYPEFRELLRKWEFRRL